MVTGVQTCALPIYSNRKPGKRVPRVRDVRREKAAARVARIEGTEATGDADRTAADDSKGRRRWIWKN
jgi:hypothetical protein